MSALAGLPWTPWSPSSPVYPTVTTPKDPMTSTTFTAVSPSEIRSGDILRATKGNDVVQGVARQSTRSHYVYLVALPQFDMSLDVVTLVSKGYTLERRYATPTEPGFYLDRSGKRWLLTSNRYDSKPWTAWDGGQFSAVNAESFAGPLTRVEVSSPNDK